MIISISTGAFYKRSIISILDIISKTTCKNIELCLNQATIDEDFDSIVNEASIRNLSIKSLHTPFDFLVYQRNETEEQWIKKCIQFAKTADIRIVVSHMIETYPMGEVQNCDVLHKENIIKFGNIDNILVTTENMPPLQLRSFLNDNMELLDFLRLNKRFLTFDTTHMAASGYSLTDSYLLLKNFIVNIHLSDFHNGVEHKILGTGSLDLPAFLGLLYKDRYQNLITIEMDFENAERNDVKTDEQAVAGLQQSINVINEYFQ